ncbi:Transcription factor iws1 [Chytridiales sp. JEL 0842]|nr:Transcription factor iws1 [Chytridiales sp. JEL 0842]
MSEKPAPTYDDIFGSGDSDSEIDNNFDLSESEDENQNQQQRPSSQSSPKSASSAPEDEDVADEYNDTEGRRSKPSAPASASAEVAALPKIKKRSASGDANVEKPKKKKKKSKARKSSAEREPEEGNLEELDPEKAKVLEAHRDFNDALERIKSSSSKRRKKVDGDDPELDEMMVNLLDKMKEAAAKDEDLKQSRQPAIAKIMLLPSVVEQLSKNQLFEQFLDNNILEGVKLWLEPLRADGSMPNLDIQQTLLTILTKMPIRTEHLRESKIGRVIMFYTKCERCVPAVAKLANELLETWMRPILGRSKNYKERSLKQVSYDATRSAQGSYEDLTAANEPTINRARVPRPVQAAFDYVPKSNIAWTKDMKKSKDSQDQFKKLANRIQFIKRKEKSAR